MMRSLLLLALLSGLLLGSPPAPARAQEVGPDAQAILGGQPPELVVRLLDEKVVVLPEPPDPGAAAHQVDALVLFERPLPVVMHYLIDGARQREYRPELRELRLVEQSERGSVYEYHLRMMLVGIVYRLRHHWDLENAQVWWDLDPRFENDLAALEGRWELHRYDAARTLARFGSRLDLGPALPAFFAEIGTRVKLPEAMHHVRRWIDSGGTYRP
jgi:hypothetical protein